MKLTKMSNEELEQLSYGKIAELYLKEHKKTLSTALLFKEVCNLLDLSENEYQNKITDFFETLTTSKEFILLNDGTWDLKSNHTVKVDMDEIYDDNVEADFEEEKDDIIDSEEDEEEEENYDTNDDVDYDDELEELSIVSEDELEEE